MHKYILLFTLLIMLAACSGGTNKAAQLRARASGTTISAATIEPTAERVNEPTPAPTPLTITQIPADASLDQTGVVVEFALLIGALCGGAIGYFVAKLGGRNERA